MGNVLNNEMGDNDDDEGYDEDELSVTLFGGDLDNLDDNLRDAVENSLLERMVNNMIGAFPQHISTKMPVIRKKPDLTIFRNTPLYREIKQNAGLPTNGKIPTDRWSLQRSLMKRENGIGAKPPGSFSIYQQRRISNLYIPNHREERLMSLESKIFVSKFNADGSKLITASQDHIIRVFDSSKGTYHRINRISAQDVSWSILDVDFSPCGEYFVYSTWSDYFIVVPLLDESEQFQWHHLNNDISRTCIFSVRFSPCGDYLLGGCNDACMYLADRHSNEVRKIQTDSTGHVDINAVSYLDGSSKLFVSGSDHGVIKLWDERCLGGESEPVGVFVGHADGICYIDSRGDGRYILSNSKDQSIKIWDLRRMSPKEKERHGRSNHNWDYRWDNVPRDYYNPTKTMDGDSSVMTYRGHRVTKSLIRAKFSPLEQTGQRYIYTGCGTGRVIIYDVLTGHIKEAIEGHKDIVRDVSWHPVRSEIVSSSWDYHVNLNTFKRSDLLNKRSSTSALGDDERPRRRSRRLAMQRNESHDGDADNREVL